MTRATALAFAALALTACARQSPTAWSQPLAVAERVPGRAGYENGVHRNDPTATSPYAGGSPRCMHHDRRVLPANCREAPATWRVECNAACVSSRLPDEALHAYASAGVHVGYNIGRDGILDAPRALDDPGCGLAAVAPATLRACCNPVALDGTRLSQLEGQSGCHTLEFRYDSP